MFEESAKQIMDILIKILPDWLMATKFFR
jgi:hypothetical protein